MRITRNILIAATVAAGSLVGLSTAQAGVSLSLGSALTQAASLSADQGAIHQISSKKHGKLKKLALKYGFKKLGIHDGKKSKKDKKFDHEEHGHSDHQEHGYSDHAEHGHSDHGYGGHKHGYSDGHGHKKYGSHKQGHSAKYGHVSKKHDHHKHSHSAKHGHSHKKKVYAKKKHHRSVKKYGYKRKGFSKKKVIY